MIHRSNCLVVVFALCLAPVLLAAQPIAATPPDARPIGRLEPFVAVYDVKTNGLNVGTLTVRLTRGTDGDYVLRQESASRGLGALFSPRNQIETSRFRISEGEIEVLEYRSRREGGDAEENARFVFDWKAGIVRSLGAGEPWEAPITRGVVDPLVLQLAMRLDLQRDHRPLEYRVPRQGRIKTYTFERVGEETIELDSSVSRTLKIERTNDSRDHTSIWSAPELGFFAVRILKQRNWDVDTDVVLKRLDPRSSSSAAR